jgi:hypothetical protein
LVPFTEPDRTTLDQTCSEIGALKDDINKLSVAQCDKDPFLKDQKALYAICSRLQREYNTIDPEVLHSTYQDLVERLNELNFKWDSFKDSVISSKN